MSASAGGEAVGVLVPEPKGTLCGVLGGLGRGRGRLRARLMDVWSSAKPQRPCSSRTEHPERRQCGQVYMSASGALLSQTDGGRHFLTGAGLLRSEGRL